MHSRFTQVLVVAAVMGAADVGAQQRRTGTPDLQGLWTNETATPLERPKEFANKPTLTEAEAAEFERTGLARLLETIAGMDPIGVQTSGDLNDSYLETSGMKLVAGRRTSLIVDPANGLLPPLVDAAKRRGVDKPFDFAIWDDPEGRVPDERCIVSASFGSSSVAPPIVPNPFAQNYYQIIQTSQYVVIFTELVHDARVI